MHTLENFYHKSNDLIKEFDLFISKTNLKNIALPDHVCFKCGRNEEFEEVRGLLETESKFLHQANISGRRIAMIKLKSGFQTSIGEITTLELSDQKPDNSQVAGFDHIEIFPKNVTFEELVQRVKNTEFGLKKVERPHHTTYDIFLGDKYNVKLTTEPIFEKIRREEMV